MPRPVGRVKRTPVPEAVRSLDLAPRHLSLLAYPLFDGPQGVNELAARLEVAPTTVSPMVGELSRERIVDRREDDADGGAGGDGGAGAGGQPNASATGPNSRPGSPGGGSP
ncbi:MarR family winged helix-turn-helix transcriptional regulator [Spongiactinospora sp. TRM90649]|uniref:MarR family winged helix-turn-helix transcriptional regulator n=1 Tax=Spongiactinospora sp. TRM90649 TaxID=3031114 RepID=UPI0023F6A558|nr:MarR family winged helix-turn-helix transcriptional regulator [Spongiactinospora sp. TRM90649]MDF5756539.1 MarR family winged helix-turn-helix transcriptional regulator [Spongiactinospora sp. TRM90649]